MEHLLLKQLKEILDEDEIMSAICNSTALLYDYFDNLNWLGFYFMKDGHLILGPFQGKVACTIIEVGKGVCGTSVKEKKVIRVENVHEFPGHIACDSASNSEIVLPMIIDGQVIGVLDIDSPLLNRFTLEDEKLLIEVTKLITQRIKKHSI